MEVKMIPFWAKTPLGKRYDGWLIPEYYWEDFAEASGAHICREIRNR